MCCNQTVPTLGVLQIEIDTASANIMLEGILPISGRFNVRINNCTLDTSSAKTITLSDAAGTVISTVIDRCSGNLIRMNKVAVQAKQHKLLHLVRATDNPALAILIDKICAPTPINDTTDSASGASGTSGSASTSTSATASPASNTNSDTPAANVEAVATPDKKAK